MYYWEAEFEWGHEEVLVGSIINGDTTGIIYDYPDDLGFNELNQSNITLYPNPATNQINVKGNYKLLQIYNSVGELIMTISNNTKTIDISALANGLYFIKGVDENDVVFSSKLIKQ